MNARLVGPLLALGWMLAVVGPSQAEPKYKIAPAPKDAKPATTPAADAQAQKVAEAWLALVDGGDYSKSWVESASMFRAAVSEQQWGQSVAAVRAPLGKVVSRTLLKATFATELPGAPDGEYVVIQYTTSFANKKKAVETVTPMKDGDGVWRVSGYYVR